MVGRHRIDVPPYLLWPRADDALSDKAAQAGISVELVDERGTPIVGSGPTGHRPAEILRSSGMAGHLTAEAIIEACAG